MVDGDGIGVSILDSGDVLGVDAVAGEGGFSEGEGVEGVAAVGGVISSVVEGDGDFREGGGEAGADDDFEEFAGVAAGVIVVKFIEEDVIASAGSGCAGDGGEAELEVGVRGDVESVKGGVFDFGEFVGGFFGVDGVGGGEGEIGDLGGAGGGDEGDLPTVLRASEGEAPLFRGVEDGEGGDGFSGGVMEVAGEAYGFAVDDADGAIRTVGAKAFGGGGAVIQAEPGESGSGPFRGSGESFEAGEVLEDGLVEGGDLIVVEVGIEDGEGFFISSESGGGGGDGEGLGAIGDAIGEGDEGGGLGGDSGGEGEGHLGGDGLGGVRGAEEDGDGFAGSGGLGEGDGEGGGGGALGEDIGAEGEGDGDGAFEIEVAKDGVVIRGEGGGAGGEGAAGFGESGEGGFELAVVDFEDGGAVEDGLGDEDVVEDGSALVGGVIDAILLEGHGVEEGVGGEVGHGVHVVLHGEGDV